VIQYTINKFATSGENKTTGDSKHNDIPEDVENVYNKVLLRVSITLKLTQNIDLYGSENIYGCNVVR